MGITSTGEAVWDVMREQQAVVSVQQGAAV